MQRYEFTTGQVAKICKISPRTVSNWVDRGYIPGAWKMPRSGDRRIPREGLVAFLKQIKHQRGLAALEASASYRVLVLAGEPVYTQAVEKACSGLDGVELITFDCPFGATAQLTAHAPDLVLVDFAAAGRSSCLAVAAIAANPLRDCAILGVLNDDDEGDRLERFTLTWKKPVDPALVAEAVRAAAEGKLGTGNVLLRLRAC